jgi:Protein of unknown function (DUF3558)
MTTGRHALLAMLFVGSATLTGCTTTSSGDPAPEDSSPATQTTESTPSPAPSADLPFAGAPKVDDPLDTTEFQQDPCTTFTSTQTTELNLDAAGEPVDSPLGNACEWNNAETRGNVQIRFNNKNPVGLSGEYQADQNGKFAFFDVLDPIEGYPAVSNDVVDRRPRGVCTVIVGVADDITFEAVVQLSAANIGEKDPCQTAADVAGMALQTMKGGA